MQVDYGKHTNHFWKSAIKSKISLHQPHLHPHPHRSTHSPFPLRPFPLHYCSDCYIRTWLSFTEHTGGGSVLLKPQYSADQRSPSWPIKETSGGFPPPVGQGGSAKQSALFPASVSTLTLLHQPLESHNKLEVQLFPRLSTEFPALLLIGNIFESCWFFWTTASIKKYERNYKTCLLWAICLDKGSASQWLVLLLGFHSVLVQFCSSVECH